MRRTLVLVVLVAGGAAVTAAPGAGRPLPGSKCSVFPRTSHWNKRVDKLPLVGNSAGIVRGIGRDESLIAGYGSGLYEGGPIGIPFRYVKRRQKRVPVSFEFAGESDRGRYPIPRNAPVEGGRRSDGDRHVLLIDRSRCRLFELYAAYPRNGGSSWRAGSGAVWNLRSNRLRRRGFTSADAAGLPIFPGLVRYDEVKRGRIDHALRMSVPRTRRAFIYPARHQAGDSSDPNLPAMGQRLRLRASFKTAGYPRSVRVVLRALKEYGVFVADNGSGLFISGAPSKGWDNDKLRSLMRVHASDLEVVDTSKLKRPRG